MNCMRCGVQTEGKEVFCRDCLDTIEKYPVKPGTPVHIPQRTAVPDARKPLKKKRENTPEEQITRLRRTVRKLSLALMAALAVIALLAGILLLHSLQEIPQNPSPRNYTATEGR